MTYRFILFILIAVTFRSCDSKKFPDSIDSQITNEHFRLKGTKLFVVKPKSFKYFEDVNVFKYSDSVFIVCQFNHGNFLNDLKKKEMIFTYNKDYKIISHQDFKINTDSGIYFLLQEAKSYWLYFEFGDSAAMNVIAASYPIKALFQDTVFDFVKKAYYKKDFNLNQLETAKFDIDISGSGFKFLCYGENQFLFDEDSAKKIYSTGKLSNLINIAQYPRTTYDSIGIKNFANTMLQLIKNKGIEVNQTILEKDFRLNNNYAFKRIFSGAYGKDKDIYYYNIVTGNSKVMIFFNATLYHNGLALIPTIDKVVNSLKIRQ